jgi:hypothetical protein
MQVLTAKTPRREEGHGFAGRGDGKIFYALLFLTSLNPCTMSRISKLEYKEDRKINIGELLDYSDALDMEMSVVFLPKKLRIVDRVKLHAAQIEHLLNRLVSLSQGDKGMAKAVDAFHGECLANMFSIIGKSQKSLRPRKKQGLNVIGPQEVEQFIEEEKVSI